MKFGYTDVKYTINATLYKTSQSSYPADSSYAKTKRLISKITDSVGRVVNFEYNEGVKQADGTFLAKCNDPQGKYSVIMYLPDSTPDLSDNKKLVYNRTTVLETSDNLYSVRSRLQGVYDLDNVLKYNYYYESLGFTNPQSDGLGFTYKNGTTYSAYNAYENLVQIQYRTNKLKRYVYGTYVKKFGDSGSMRYRKVIEKQELAWTGWDDTKTNYLDKFICSMKNKNTYTYTNEPDGFGYSGYIENDQTYLKNTYRYYTQIADMRGAITKDIYDGLGETVSTEYSGSDHKEVSAITYDSNKFPQKKELLVYNVINGQVSGNSVKKTENYAYDQWGNLTSYTDPLAARDATGNPTNSEHTTAYTYATDKYHILTSKSWKQDLAITCRTEYDVDSKGNVTQMRKIHTGNNIVADYQYDTYGNMTKETNHFADNSGNIYTNSYEYGIDADGTDQKGAYLTKEYATVDSVEVPKKHTYDFYTGNKKSDVDENGNRTSYDYDMFNRIIGITNPDNSTKQYQYFDYWNSDEEIWYIDGNGNYNSYIYDILGNYVKHSLWNCVNSQWQWSTMEQVQYDSNSNKTKEIDAYGHSTRLVYDSANRLKEKSFWSNDTTKTKSISLSYTTSYDTNTPLLITTTDEDGYVKKYYYDILNRLYKLDTTPDKTNFYSTNYTYNYVGDKTSEADTYNHAVTYTYDDLGRLKTAADALSHTTQYSYDAGDKLTQETNPRGKSTYYDYDLLKRLIRKKDPATDGTQAITRYIYDAAGNKVKEIRPNYYDLTKDTSTSSASSMTGMSYTYDSMNRLQTTLSPEGSVIAAMSYDANGNVKKVVDGLLYTGDINTSSGTTHVYDAFNRKTQETDALGNIQSYTYYLTGQLNTYTDANNNTTTYYYYPDSKLQEVLYPDTGFITYTYDNRGYKASEKDQNGNITNYKYNGFGKIDTITDAKLNTTVYGYYNNGNLYSVKDKRGHYTYYSYYNDNDLQQKKTSIDSSNFAIENYVTDESSNVKQKTLTGTLDSSSSRVTAYTYYDSNLLQTATDTSSRDSSGSYTKNYYDKNNNLTKVETKRDASNNDVLKYAYDNRDRKVASIKLVDESDVYNAAGLPNIANLRDSEYPGKIQLTTGYVYDILSNLTATIESRAYGYLATDTANRNLYTVYNSYDTLNRLKTITKMINGVNVYTKYYYDAASNKKAAQDERGFYTVCTYDCMNRPLTLTDSETDTSLKGYTDTQIISLTNQKTNTLKKAVFYGYDLAGNKTSVIDANGYKTDYVYDYMNRLCTVKAPYDTSKPDSQTNPYNQVIDRKTYDENSNVIKRIDAKGYLSGSDDGSRYGTEYTYGYANQLVAVLDPEGKSKGLTYTNKYVYNQYGEKTKKTDACNNSTSYYYNSAGELLNVTDALNIVTNYTYDNAGNMLTKVNGRTKTTGYQYGAFGLLRAMADASIKAETYKHDLAGNTADLLNRNGNETKMTYDLRNMLLSKSVTQTGDSISYTYDNAGNRVTMTDASGTSSYSYDANNRPLNVSKGGVSQVSYTYDKAGNVLTVTDSKGFTTTYAYDTANRMSTVSYVISGSSKTTTYSYDINGNRQSIAYPGTITESYQYDKNNRLTTLTNTTSGGTISNYQYTYYDNGLQHTKNDSYGQSTYTYDGDGRIQQVTWPGKTTIYSYDNAGNRQSMDETYTSDQFSGHIDQTTGNEIKYAIKHSDYVYSSTNALMQLTETMKNTSGTEVLRRTANYQYDYNGNQISQQSEYLQTNNPSASESFYITAYASCTTTFDNNLERTENTYDGFNRLTKVDAVKSGSRAISLFTYNGDDLRVKKVVEKSTSNYAPEETDYLYNGQYVILETDSSNNVKVRYILGVNYIGRVDASNKLSYFMYNGHGDVVQTVSESGTVENQYDYDIWGNPTLTVEQYGCAIRYAGEFYDSETGLYYLRARYYDSYTGRFISEDSYWGKADDPLSLNLYTYTENDPINFFDPTGHTSVNLQVGLKTVGNAKITSGTTTGNLTDIVTGLGGATLWNGSTGQATATIGGSSYVFDTKAKAYYKVGDEKNTTSFAISSDGHIQVGARAFTESTGASVKYESTSGNAKITVTPSATQINAITNTTNAPSDAQAAAQNYYMNQMQSASNNSTSQGTGNSKIPTVSNTEPGKNPSKQDATDYITQKAEKMGIPVQLALATAWTENSFEQFNVNGKAGPNDSGDYGLMQINKCHQNDKGIDWDKISTNWQYNVDYGLGILKDSYNEAKQKGEGDKGPDSKDENLARSAYSLYNSGSAYFRYRTTYDDAKSTYADTGYAKYINGYYNGPRNKSGYDLRDINFMNHYENKDWTK